LINIRRKCRQRLNKKPKARRWSGIITTRRCCTWIRPVISFWRRGGAG
jgi:hypothetical protein